MSGTNSGRRVPAWSLFPSTKEVHVEMNISSPSERRGAYNLQNAFRSDTSAAPSFNVEEEEERKDEDRAATPTRVPITPTAVKTSIPVEKSDAAMYRKEMFGRSDRGLNEPLTTPVAKERPLNSHPPPRISSRTDHRDHQPAMRPSSATGHRTASSVGSRSRSREGSISSYHTNATSLPALQQKPLEEHDQLAPLDEEELDPGSFDLVAPPEVGNKQYSLETRSELLFSAEHLRTIFNDPTLFLRFTGFLSSERTSSIPILLFYLEAKKALKAMAYANAVAQALDPIEGFDFTTDTAPPARNPALEEKANKAFEAMVRDDLPAYITHVYIRTVSLSIQRRITGTLPVHLREASEGLAEVFCLTDPSRPDNPIVFASEEFHKTTQYGMSYVLGRNCRFLQGPKTNPFSVKRLRERIDEGKEHFEVFLNYRRDGSPFMNLLMIAPLCDSRGTIRYFIGAQVDVSGLVKECSDLESLQRITILSENQEENDNSDNGQSASGTEKFDPAMEVKKQFQELSEMLDMDELETVRKRGGRMRQFTQDERNELESRDHNWNKRRLLISATSPEGEYDTGPISRVSGRLSGIFENYLLIRPYPSLRVLFASPTLRVPGILQSPFMDKIGGSGRVREELERALADGRGVTAKVRWMATKHDTEGRNRWIHCTPLIGINNAVGVWMIVIADDEETSAASRRYKMAPPVDPSFGRTVPFARQDDNFSLKDFAKMNGGRASTIREGAESFRDGGTEHSGSPYTLRID